ncbi:MAG: L-threonylcarbamoyladenylate synthase [Thermodesulfobacteriota bacterium]|nr:L-threonylcarbamoyladenylate synthase [Thermodesulfobacteriota bacterium]
MSELIKINSSRPDPLTMQRAARLIKRDGIIAFPTETVYGLGANALSEKAIMRVFQIKGRDPKKPIPILIDKKETLCGLVTDIPEKGEILMKNFWPGGLTIVFEASSKIPPLLLGNTGKIGVRISSCNIVQKLVEQAGTPITATSANISGQKNCSSATEVYENLGEIIDMILDGGKTAGYLGSTVIDVTCCPAKIIREGVIRSRDIKRYL